jgi:pantoate--beta-alanine ligase
VWAHVDQWNREGLTSGLVPTMGALHAGHVSLVRAARQACQRVAATIFVNPTQFGPNEDFQRYPRTLESDLQLLRDAGADLVFIPSAETMYPPESSTLVQPPRVAEPLEGQFRPGHFAGVATIVLKLFHLLPTTSAYFGQKDYQQSLVIRHMIEDLNVPIRIETCATVRESDGLAMSSRNRYLSSPQRAAALSLWKALQQALEQIRGGQRQIARLESGMRARLLAEGAERVDYARIVRRDTLADMTELDGPAVALIAAHVGSTRLIDNLMLEPDGA